MSEKLLEIHGFLSQQGGILGATEDFKYFEIDIPELHFPSVDVAGVSLDILVTVLIAKSSVPANVGKQATRRIKAVAIRAASKVITVSKTVEGVVVDTEMELAQTNLVVYKNRLFLAVTGTSSGDLFSCSAGVRYLATGAQEVPKHRRPVEQVVSGTIVDYPNSSSDIEHNDLSGRSETSCHPGTAISYDNINSGLAADEVQGAIDELDSTLDGAVSVTDTVSNIITATKEPTGFENRTSSTLSYDASARQFTLTAVTDTYYWIKGERFMLAAGASVISTAHVDVDDVYFFYFNASNVATVANGFWNLETTCPIAFVLYDTLSLFAQGILCDERHGIVMDWATHAHLHFSKGAFVRSGFTIDDASYVIGSSVADEKKYRIGDGYFVDEDITLYHDDASMMEVLPADRSYPVLARRGSSGKWWWTISDYPVDFSPTTRNPYFNEYDSIGATWKLTEITATNKWINMFTCVTNSTDPQYKIVNIMGQKQHSSLAAAEEESVLELAWGTAPFQEITPIYQVTFRRGPYGSAGPPINPNVRMDAVQKIIGVSITLSGLLASNHASLAGRDLPNSHPASAISYDITSGIGDLYSTDMQHVVEEITEQMGRCAQTGTITRDVDGNVTGILIENPKGDMQITITRDIDGNATEVLKEYTDGTDTYTRTITISRDGDGYVTGWGTV